MGEGEGGRYWHRSYQVSTQDIFPFFRSPETLGEVCPKVIAADDSQTLSKLEVQRWVREKCWGFGSGDGLRLWWPKIVGEWKGWWGVSLVGVVLDVGER